MQKSKVRGALLTSLLSLVICIAMLTGSTFAWFTDTAGTGVNKIVSGKLEIALEVYENGQWVSAANKELNFQKAGSAVGENIVWEPGCTYQLPQLRVVNKGNLAITYRISITGIGEDATLNNVIDWTINSVPLKDFVAQTPVLAAGAEGMPFVVSGTMDPNAGNQYQGLSIDGITIAVSATQAASERDSYGDSYDVQAVAALPELPVVVTNETELNDAFTAQAKEIRISGSIALSAPVTINYDTTIVGNDTAAAIRNSTVCIGETANVTFRNVRFENPVNAENNATSVYADRLGGKVVFEGCTFTNFQLEAIQVALFDGAEIIVNNCTFVLDGTDTLERMLHIDKNSTQNNTGAYTATITNNSFTGVDLVTNSVIDVDNVSAFENVTCGGNTFYNCGDTTPVTALGDEEIYVNIAGKHEAPYLATNTFAQFTQTPAEKLQG